MTVPDKVNILLVDDQPAKLLSYEVILQNLGENLLKASSANEAFNQLLKHDVAVILIDVCMPDLDGFELAAMIREHPRCQATAIIFISAVHLTDLDRLRGYAMGAVDYVPVPVIAEVLRAKVKIFTELYRKTQQLEQLNRELESRVAERTAELESYAAMLLQSERRRNLALAAGKMGSWDWDVVRGDCMWDEGHCDIFGVDAKDFKVTPERVRALVDPADWHRLSRAWSEGAMCSRSYETEFRVRRPNGEVRWCFGTAAATVDESNRLVRISGVTRDITERKRAEERQSFLAREVDHRARNVLAVVQSILRLTKSQNVDDYVAAVEGRIKALSHAHMLLSESRWEGADLGRLVTEELDPYGISDAVSMDGPETILDPRRAQTLALAVHELATNAAKYGALSTSCGKVKLTWRIEESGLAIEWLESGGPEVHAPDTQGYGTRVIRASLEQLGGRTVFDWQQTGLRCTLSLPHDAKLKLGNRLRSSKRPGTRSLFQFMTGNTVLLVEDESMVAMMVEQVLTELGLCVAGPCGTIGEALRAANEISVDAAILDINLGGQSVYPVVDLLIAKGVPIAFISGYGTESVDSRYAHIPLMQKPIDRRVLLFSGGLRAGLRLTLRSELSTHVTSNILERVREVVCRHT
jgi:PAS domain S-box-containing protein